MAYTLYESDSASKELLESIIGDLDFGIKDINFDDPYLSLPESLLKATQAPLDKLSGETVTSRRVNGTGIYDAFMKAFSVHIMEEYDAGRITGAEYTKAYIALAGVAMQCATQFALGKDKAYYDALNAQINAVNANVANATAKVQLAIARAQIHQNKATYAATVLKLAEQDAQYAVIKENYEATRAQTLDKRTDGTTIVGSIGKQKELYDKQIWAYQRDAEYKAAGIWSNAYITMKGIDEGLDVPTQYNKSNIDSIMSQLRTNLPL